MKARALFISIVVSLGAVVWAADLDLSKLPPASERKGLTFEKDIKPLFDKSCVDCHGAEKPKAKLRLDSLEATLKGSIDHKVIDPGNSTNSILVHNIAYLGGEDYWMPPPDEKEKYPQFTKEEIGVVRAWIDQGAK